MSRVARIVLAALMASLVPPIALADDIPDGERQTYPIMDFGIARGGDKILDAHFFVGGRESIHAGDAVYGDVGLLHDFRDSDWSFKLTGGYAFASIGSFWSSRTFKRFPLDALAVYSFDRQHIGFGVTYHFNPQLDMNGHGADVRYHDAAGAILQYQYWLFGVRYTYIRYRPEALPGAPSFDGSSLGLFVSIVFGKP